MMGSTISLGSSWNPTNVEWSKGGLMKILLIVGLLTLVVVSPVLGEAKFEKWVKAFKSEALEKGISSSLANRAFDGISPIPRIIELDRKQPEGRMTFGEYRKKIVSQIRIQRGREMMAQHRDLLNQIGQHYGVQPRFIVALWGIETNYGKNTGGYSVVNALATLAFDGRRSQYFRTELLNALKILQDDHISLELMKGSWAGAMGQCQFMPSSFLRLAVDYDGDGRKDIWKTPADVFASAANYLSQSGWRGNQTWGRQAQLPGGFNNKDASLKIKKSLNTWQKFGVRRSNGKNLPLVDMQGSIVLPDGKGGPAFLVYENFRVIMKWNRSTYFATSVGLLADALAQ